MLGFTVGQEFLLNIANQNWVGDIKEWSKAYLELIAQGSQLLPDLSCVLVAGMGEKFLCSAIVPFGSLIRGVFPLAMKAGARHR